MPGHGKAAKGVSREEGSLCRGAWAPTGKEEGLVSRELTQQHVPRLQVFEMTFAIRHCCSIMVSLIINKDHYFPQSFTIHF